MGMELSAREMMEKLISFPSVSSVSNLPIIDFIEEYLNSHGVECHRVYNPAGDKANLYANAGPAVDGGVILSGHTDVVPVVGQDWDTDPFKVVEKDGKLYGRGTCDMKGFDAIALTAVPKALKRGIKRPIQIAMSYDEEVGCIGAPFMAAEMAKLMPKASAAIIGEPSMMKAVSGHKGGLGIKTHVRGFEVHSSLQHIGVSAIHEAAKLIEWANQMNIQNELLDRSEATSMFIPPWTTVHVGTIEGGTANNITAKDCHFVMGFRVIPNERAADWKQAYESKVREVEAAMKKINPDSFIMLDAAHDVPGLRPEDDGTAEALVRKLTGDNGQHVVSYGTEAGQFQAEGYSSIICGPGDIAQAHQKNEFITLEQFSAGENFMDQLIENLAT
jgi:acetylornithine deacetylase|tara:strand:+ start:15057 stop:16220 length:1164 start_codon:yes stop_codon:yes gene_type:complete